MLNIDAAITAFGTLVAMLVVHNVADHWIQTSCQAMTKGGKGWAGRWACARHVCTYTAATAGVVGLLGALHLAVFSVWGFLLGQVVSAVSHYWADRRTTLAALAAALGSGEFYRLGASRQVAGFVERADGGMDRVLVCEVDEEGKPALGVEGEPGKESIDYVTVSHDNPTLGTGAYALDLLCTNWSVAGERIPQSRGLGGRERELDVVAVFRACSVRSDNEIEHELPASSAAESQQPGDQPRLTIDRRARPGLVDGQQFLGHGRQSMDLIGAVAA